MATAAAVGVAPFTGVTWPPPGQWLASAAPPELCRAGVHALLADSLATWTAEELWRVELDGAWELAPGIMVASRGRLLGRVEAWNDQTAREFARACATHVREHTSGRAAEYAADAATAAAEAVACDSGSATSPRMPPRRWRPAGSLLSGVGSLAGSLTGSASQARAAYPPDSSAFLTRDAPDPVTFLGITSPPNRHSRNLPRPWGGI
jgi:hypothetical protein